MAKQGMARPDRTHTHPKNEVSPVPQIQGKAKSGQKSAPPIVAGTRGATQQVYHQRPISDVYRELDNDLARDNMENDLPAADLTDI